MTIRAVLFDLDGTLLASIDGILASFAHVLGTYLPHKSYTRMELILKIGEPVKTQMMQFTGGDDPLATLMAEAYREHNFANLPKIGLYPRVRECLTELRRRGFRTGLVTSKSERATSSSLDTHQLRSFFDIILTCDDTPRHKPDPMPLLVAAERLGILPGEIAYVGDSVHDVNCALGAGSVAIAALWGPFEELTLAALGPRHLLRTLDELLALPELAKS